MEDIYGLIEYFSASRPLIVVGSGPSCDAGLPSWKGLTEKVLEHIRPLRTPAVEDAELAFARDDYAAVLGIAYKVAGPADINLFCESLLSDNYAKGKQYQLRRAI
jgi:hypothetical protein